MNAFRFLPTSRKGSKLILNESYLYDLSKSVGSKRYWRCSEKGCKATAITDGNVLIAENKDHASHSPHFVEIQKRDAINAMTSEIKEHPSKAVPLVFEEVRARILRAVPHQVQEEAAVGCPQYKSVKSLIYRKKQEYFPKQPQSLQELEITGDWAKTVDKRNFLLSSEGSENKIVVFATLDFLNLLCEADSIFMDGTFKSAPILFKQIYTLHAVVLGEMVPLVYVFLKNKDEATYSRMFRMIKDAASGYGLEFSPNYWHLDYESAVFSALRNSFTPAPVVRGCYFHFSKAIWSKVQKFHLETLYRENEMVRSFISRTSALGLVPMETIDSLWATIKSSPILLNTPRINRFIEYMERTWLNPYNALFSRLIWNHFDNEGLRTTNHLEGWHNTINRKLGKMHPNVFEVIEMIKVQQEKFETDLQQLRLGKAPKKSRKLYRDKEEKLQRLKEKFVGGEVTSLEYLDGVKYIIKLKSHPLAELIQEEEEGEETEVAGV